MGSEDRCFSVGLMSTPTASGSPLLSLMVSWARRRCSSRPARRRRVRRRDRSHRAADAVLRHPDLLAAASTPPTSPTTRSPRCAWPCPPPRRCRPRRGIASTTASGRDPRRHRLDRDDAHLHLEPRLGRPSGNVGNGRRRLRGAGGRRRRHRASALRRRSPRGARSVGRRMSDIRRRGGDGAHLRLPDGPDAGWVRTGDTYVRDEQACTRTSSFRRHAASVASGWRQRRSRRRSSNIRRSSRSPCRPPARCARRHPPRRAHRRQAWRHGRRGRRDRALPSSPAATSDRPPSS